MKCRLNNYKVDDEVESIFGQRSVSQHTFSVQNILTMSLSPFAAELIENARAIAAAGKGILAADESTGTIGSRFKAINVENTEENRRKYRQLLFKTEGKSDLLWNKFELREYVTRFSISYVGLEQHISGVILFEETLYQKTDEGMDFVQLLKQKGMIPGIKVSMACTSIKYFGASRKVTHAFCFIRLIRV